MMEVERYKMMQGQLEDQANSWKHKFEDADRALQKLQHSYH